ncbi:MAG: hypothetical protein KJZ86_10920 [Caldilineaceae bacterium]|nr:hypothetical protein [Caldilineaceae bacterium]HRJ41134.1 hypothetical protein [Caldilineaceae bacterium]
MSATTIAAPAAGAATRPTGIIDCDVHHQYAKPETLFPYLPRHYVEYIKDFSPIMPGIGYANMPGNGARTDLWTDTEVNPATQPPVCIEKHLDVYPASMCAAMCVSAPSPCPTPPARRIWTSFWSGCTRTK